MITVRMISTYCLQFLVSYLQIHYTCNHSYVPYIVTIPPHELQTPVTHEYLTFKFTDTPQLTTVQF